MRSVRRFRCSPPSSSIPTAYRESPGVGLSGVEMLLSTGRQPASSYGVINAAGGSDLSGSFSLSAGTTDPSSGNSTLYNG